MLGTLTIHKLRKAVGYMSCKYLYIQKQGIIPFFLLLIITSPYGKPALHPTVSATYATFSEPE